MLFVLDASAMIAYLRDEPGAGRVSEALLDPDGQCIAHVLNLCEVFYDFQRGNSGKLVGKLVRETRLRETRQPELRDFLESLGLLVILRRICLGAAAVSCLASLAT
ncbi:MAG: hypothetical protein ABSF25_08800 [Bryobacteraceae bacterium]